jgi:hypothetical protein
MSRLPYCANPFRCCALPSSRTLNPQVLLGPHSFSSIASRLAELGVRLMLTEGEAAGAAGAAAAGAAAAGGNKQQLDGTRLLSGASGAMCDFS